MTSASAMMSSNIEMESASERMDFDPYHIPTEIVIEIIKHVGKNRATLLNVIKVSSVWFDIGTSFLWREPPIHALIALPPARRQYYADKIELLCTSEEEGSQGHYETKNLTFPRLEWLSIDHGVDVFPIGQYLQSSLTFLSFAGGRPEEDVLALLAVRCKNMKQLSIDDVPSYWDTDGVIAMLDHFKDLECFRMGQRLPQHIDGGRLILYLANRPKIWSLKASCDNIGYHALSRVAALGERTRIYPNIRGLELDIDWDAVTLIPAFSKNIIALKLGIFGRPQAANVFAVVGTMISVKILELHIDNGQPLQRQDLRNLAKLKNLRRMIISIRNHPATYDALADTDFTHLFLSLPNLEGIAWHAGENFPLKAFLALGLHCQRLHFCEMSARIDLLSLQQSPRICFPSLDTLKLSSGVSEENINV
ncbi:hypothetical protein K470DRAFT_128017 [Piedraia hortae CBS 480.64]|uniref:F-box domain-containing protein n=1 Tax=Piedraia hortae CBS 480.64 TaxID=1314780 RepID=A0A6A7BU77_9PEZI|nr:hypothetical protein K470DRAFT_128017 [Piedraia hortae CBS 480.64]